MRFCSFKRKSDNKDSWGVMSGPDTVADFSSIAPDLRSFLEKDGLTRFSQIERETKNHPQLNISEVVLKACLPNPPTIRDGYAFRNHVEASRRNRNLPMIPEFEEFPVFYYGEPRSIIGPGDVKVQSKHLDHLDFELEVGVVIGKKGKNIPAEKADEYIAGYMIWNDWSARALQVAEMKLSMGPVKGKDFANAFGPWLVTREELASKKIPGPKGERFDLSMKAFVNGKQYSNGNLKGMSFTFAQIIERASYGCTIYPGDVFGSGTVGSGCIMEGVGYAPSEKWIKEGDEVELQVEGLGVLKNKVVLVGDELE